MLKNGKEIQKKGSALVLSMKKGRMCQKIKFVSQKLAPKSCARERVYFHHIGAAILDFGRPSWIFRQFLKKLFLVRKLPFQWYITLLGHLNNKGFDPVLPRVPLTTMANIEDLLFIAVST